MKRPATQVNKKTYAQQLSNEKCFFRYDILQIMGWRERFKGSDRCTAEFETCMVRRKGESRKSTPSFCKLTALCGRDLGQQVASRRQQEGSLGVLSVATMTAPFLTQEDVVALKDYVSGQGGQVGTGWGAAVRGLVGWSAACGCILHAAL